MERPLTRLLAAIREVVAPTIDAPSSARQVAELLARWPLAGLDLTVDGDTGETTGPAHHLLHAEPDGSFSVVAIVWQPGDVTEIHDHLCWGAIVVLEGEEHETRFRLEPVEGGVQAVPQEELVNGVWSVSPLIPPGDVHRVENRTHRRTVSLHVYGEDWTRTGTSIRRTYREAALTH